MRRFVIIWITVFVTTITSFATPQVYGWLEHIYVGSADYRLNAKLDSGAKTSSLDARSIQRYESKAGREMVRFKMSGERHDGEQWVKKKIVLRKPVHRKVKIKSSNGISQERLTVLMPVTIGEKSVQTEFTLSSRSRMSYPVLLGRTAISKIGLIDCSATYKAKRSVKKQTQ